MDYIYGECLSLRENVKLNFYVDGILPAGQLGYTETHYKIRFEHAEIILSATVCEMLLKKKSFNVTPPMIDEPIPEPAPEPTKKTSRALKKHTKDDLIAMASAIDSTEDLTKLNKGELIGIIQESR